MTKYRVARTTSTIIVLALCLMTLYACRSIAPDCLGERELEQKVWHIDNLEEIGGHPVTVVGTPRVIKTPAGKAVEFAGAPEGDGRGDALFFDVHPLAGWDTFTVEVIFMPYSGGLSEQRFFHMQDGENDDRVMFETRLTDDNRWYLDTFIRSGAEGFVLYADEFKHKIDAWHHAAIVVDGETFSHYVNGKKEMTVEIEYSAQSRGITSLGCRINQVWWYKGAIRKARFTRGVLGPEEFLSP